jgi:hypothetical protein
MNEASKGPVYASETPELWAQVKAAATAGDEMTLRDLLTAMDLSPRLGKLFTVAVAEEAELAAIEKAGEGQAEKVRSIEEQLCFLNAAAAPTKIEKMREVAEQRQQLQAERLAAERAVAAAKTASRQRAWLRFWLTELFGEQPLEHGGVLSSLQPSPKVFDVAASLKIGGNVYMVGENGWRKINESNEADKPRRRYTSFSPATPRQR